ncbi:MAG: hypothetical protein D6830_05770 [Ignavibacteria bacterium]|nr:MAG: hypothetical protein D6830_05770 [Ignavibacteria bacterium]
MIIWDELKSINSSEKELKKFGITMAVVLALIALLLLYNNSVIYLYFFAAAAFFGAFGLAIPNLLLPFHKLWMGLAVTLGFIMTRVILSILFFLVFTPMSLIAKLVGKSFLDIKMDKSENSYWHYREKKEYIPENTEKQF